MASDQQDRLPCWCGQGSWNQVFRTPCFGLLHCSACHSYRIDPPPIRTSSESSEFYTTYYQNVKSPPATFSHSFSRTSRFWKVAEQIPSLEHAKNLVVDIGCGDGHLCAELQMAGWPSVVGIDVSQERIARARQSYPQVTFYDRPIEATDIAQHSVDLIIMDNVIEHLPDPVTILEQLCAYMRPDGKIVLITPNLESGHFRLLGRRWTPELAPHTHIFLFTPASLARLMVKAGFLVETQGHFHLPPSSWLAQLRRLMGGDIKGAIWSTMQEAGAIYGRLSNAGPMLYAVAYPRHSAGAKV